MLPVEVDEVAITEALISAGLLSQQDANDAGRVAAALAEVVSTWCRNA
ncbi:hypothetical protein IVA94_35725 [Bradyrhizobium sp. 156]|nr:hypothetical protein [Bradyrhizobium sp. 156]MCK1326122.1 hypothetical protein [Bradyrhizobium sp. 156]